MQTKMLVKGIGLGIVAGALVAAAVVPWEHSHKRQLRSKANNMFKTLGHVVDNVTDAFF